MTESTATVRPSLSIELTVTCPTCEHFFDMVADTNLNEEGWLLNQILPEESWANAHDSFKCHVNCPECSVEFDVHGVQW